MTAPRKKQTRAERQKESDRKQRKFARSPCDRPPITPTNLFSEFDRLGVPRYHRLRAKFRWNEVHEDTSGFIIAIRHYQLELEYSAQDQPGTWFDAERYMVPPKDDNEPNNKVHFIVKGSIVANLAYRWRVRAIARGGCKSDWSAWVDMGDPGGDNPPAPTRVKIYAGSIDRVVVDWDHTPNPIDDEILDERVAHYGCMISQHQDFRDIYKRDIFVHGTQRTFKVAEDDLGTQFYARAWAVGTDKDKSAKVPATLNGNNDPFVQASGVTVDSPQFSKIPSGVIHKWPGPLGKIPAGWLNCNGDAYSITQYAELFAAIGYRYSSSPSGPTFQVPDLRGRFWKGAKSNQLEGEVDDGYGAALAEVDRDDNHGKHPRHKHKHHHKNKRRDHDNHPAGDTDGNSGGHNHTMSAGNSPISGPSGGGIDNIPTGGGRTAAGPAHNHDISGNSGPGGSGHSHPGIGGNKIQGQVAKQQYGAGVVSPLTGLIPAHGDHIDFYVEPDGANSVMDWSTLGGARGSIIVPTDPWDGGETDSNGNFTAVDEDVVLTSQNKGHRKHPQMRGHHIIKT